MDLSKYTQLLENAGSDGQITIDRESLQNLISMNTKKTRAPNSFILWKNANKDSIKQMLVDDGVDVTTGKIAAKISKKAGEIWKGMADEEKVEWKDKSNVLKEQIDVQKLQNPDMDIEPKKKRGRGRPRKNKAPEEIEVVNMEFSGVSYLVDKKTSDVYSDDGSKIGKVVDGSVSLD